MGCMYPKTLISIAVNNDYMQQSHACYGFSRSCIFMDIDSLRTLSGNKRVGVFVSTMCQCVKYMKNLFLKCSSLDN